MALDEMTFEHAEVIVLILGQSVAMEFYESSTEKTWQVLDETISKLRTTGTASPFPNHLPKTIGKTIENRGHVVRVLHRLDRPDLIWEDRTMDT